MRENEEGNINCCKRFVCGLRVDTMKGIVEPDKEISFFDQVDFLKSFC